MSYFIADEFMVVPSIILEDTIEEKERASSTVMYVNFNPSLNIEKLSSSGSISERVGLSESLSEEDSAKAMTENPNDPARARIKDKILTFIFIFFALLWIKGDFVSGRNIGVLD